MPTRGSKMEFNEDSKEGSRSDRNERKFISKRQEKRDRQKILKGLFSYTVSVLFSSLVAARDYGSLVLKGIGIWIFELCIQNGDIRMLNQPIE